MWEGPWYEFISIVLYFLYYICMYYYILGLFKLRPHNWKRVSLFWHFKKSGLRKRSRLANHNPSLLRCTQAFFQRIKKLASHPPTSSPAWVALSAAETYISISWVILLTWKCTVQVFLVVRSWLVYYFPTKGIKLWFVVLEMSALQ